MIRKISVRVLGSLSLRVWSLLALSSLPRQVTERERKREEGRERERLKGLI